MPREIWWRTNTIITGSTNTIYKFDWYFYFLQIIIKFMNETKLNKYVKEFTAIFVVWVAFFVLVVKKFLKPGQDIFYHFFVGIRAARPGPVFFSARTRLADFFQSDRTIILLGTVSWKQLISATNKISLRKVHEQKIFTLSGWIGPGSDWKQIE